MTDKQIIIDGVDVKKCVYHESGYCTISKEAYCYCCDKPNCHYKNWQRKEQKCEELKAKCKKYGEINEQETKDYAELKTERDSYIDKYFLESQKVVNLRKVLTEIKEIAEENKETAQYKGICFSILKKISEVEDGN